MSYKEDVKSNDLFGAMNTIISKLNSIGQTLSYGRWVFFMDEPEKTLSGFGLIVEETVTDLKKIQNAMQTMRPEEIILTNEKMKEKHLAIVASGK